MIERRELGRSGVQVTALGFGGGPIGNLRRAISDEEAAATVEAAWAAGVRYFDTAPLYGHGRSETRLGAALRAKPRDEFVLSTKVGRLLQPARSPDFDRHGFADTPNLEIAYDYSRDGALRSLEASLERLGLDRVDIALIHDIDRWTHGDRQPEMLKAALDGAYPALAELKAQGVVRAIGLGVNEWQVCRDVAERVPVDCFLLAGRYTLLEQEPAEAFLPFCQERGISLIVGGPYNSGILVTGPVPGAWHNYAPAPEPILDRARRLEATLARHGVPLPAAALQFPLRHPAIATVIPGLLTPEEVTATLASITHPIPAEAWDELRRRG